MPENIVSKDYRLKNRDLINEVTYDIYRIDEMMNSIPPTLARAILASFFGKIQEIGIR
jgi:hypothetical protein